MSKPAIVILTDHVENSYQVLGGTLIGPALGLFSTHLPLIIESHNSQYQRSLAWRCHRHLRQLARYLLASISHGRTSIVVGYFIHTRNHPSQTMVVRSEREEIARRDDCCQPISPSRIVQELEACLCVDGFVVSGLQHVLFPGTDCEPPFCYLVAPKRFKPLTKV